MNSHALKDTSAQWLDYNTIEIITRIVIIRILTVNFIFFVQELLHKVNLIVKLIVKLFI